VSIDCQRSPRLAEAPPPALQNGDRLTAATFLRRYEEMPEVKKAELINRTVCMASPVSALYHAEPDNLLQLLLGFYAQSVNGVLAATNATVILSREDVIQPDGLLRKDPDHGGATSLDEKGYLVGAPEFIAEIAASSASIDLHAKLDACRRAGVWEYLVWETYEDQTQAWQLVEDEYLPLAVEGDCIVSRVFPGLRFHVAALRARDGRTALAALR